MAITIIHHAQQMIINAVMDSIIRHLRNTMPENFTLRTDNGPQFISDKFNKNLIHTAHNI